MMQRLNIITEDEPLDEQPLPQGVQSSRVIDLITHSSTFQRPELHIIDNESPDRIENFLSCLEEKLNNYLDYILDGHFRKQFPAYFEGEFLDSRPLIVLRIQEPDSSELAEKLQQMIKAFSSFLASTSIDFEWRKYSG